MIRPGPHCKASSPDGQRDAEVRLAAHRALVWLQGRADVRLYGFSLKMHAWSVVQGLWTFGRLFGHAISPMLMLSGVLHVLWRLLADIHRSKHMSHLHSSWSSTNLLRCGEPQAQTLQQPAR